MGHKRHQLLATLVLPTLVVGLTLSLTAVLSACDKKTSQTEPQAATQRSASQPSAATAQQIELLSQDVMTAKAERYQPDVTITGTLQANERTAVQSTVNAQVVQVFADVGQAVKQGDPLIQLDNRNSKDQLAQAQADLAAAQAQARVAESLAQKNKVLFSQGFVSQIEYERSQAEAIAQQEAVKARKAQVSSVSRMSQDTVITAPRSGVIGSRSVNVGQGVGPGQSLMEIIDPNKLEFAANVPSEAQDQLSIGQSIPFTIANSPLAFVGQISRIAPQVDPITRQLAIYVVVKSTQNGHTLQAGQYATGKLAYGQIQVGVLIPMTAVSLTTPAKAAASTATSPSPTQPAMQANTTGTVWVIDKNKRLYRQSVHIIRRDDAHSQFLVDGIEQGTVVVLTRLNDSDLGKTVTLK